MSLAQALLLGATLCVARAEPRLAIGTFGLKPANRDGEVADLVAARLSKVAQYNLVERRELDRVLREASLNLSGVVRARDAVRIGQMLRADQFLLGSSAPINGTNRLFIRLVNAKTGVIQGIEVLSDTGAADALAGNIVEFLRGQKEHPVPGHRDYLAIGVVQNMAVNNRYPDFPAQMRGSVAAHLTGKATVLERDVVSFVANEVRLDMAGLAENSGGKIPEMQFGFWIVDGFYQPFEAAEPVVQLKLRVERVLGGKQSFFLEGKPDEPFFAKVSNAIERALDQPAAADEGVAPTKQGEIAALETRGKQLLDYRRPSPIMPLSISLRSARTPDKVMSALEEATRVYESILLLDPTNNAAKMRLAGCLIFEAQNWGGVKRDQKEERVARARDFYREVIASGDPENADDARITLTHTFGGLEGVKMMEQFARETKDVKTRSRFRAYRNDLLLWAEYKLPLETVMPHLRTQLLEVLTDFKESSKEPAFLSFDGVLFAWRNDQVRREQIINSLLPEIIEQFPDLKPHILLAAAGEQATTNSPVTAQFLASLKQCEEHPEMVWHASSYFTHLSSTIEDEKDVREHGGLTLSQRTFSNHQYATVIAEVLARQRAAEKGLAPAVTPLGKKRLAESYMALQQWKQALDLFTQLSDVTPQVKNECRRHLGLATESEEVADSEWKDKGDLNKVEIAYECIGRGQWATALAIMESIGHRTVRMNRSGPWGDAFTPVLPAVVADECRARAGKPAVKDPMRFEIAEKPYASFAADGARFFSVEVEGEDLWMSTYSQFKLFHGNGPFSVGQPTKLYEFERTTETMNTSICVGKDYVWAGSYDDGLAELDRKTGKTRRFTTKDGLMVNRISQLKLQGQTLWIVYEKGDNGSLGTLDLATHKFSTLTANLSAGAGVNSQPAFNQGALEDPHQAPQLPVTCMTEGDAGEMWFVVNGKGLQRFRSSDKSWDTLVQMTDRTAIFPSMAADSGLGLLVLAKREYRSLDGEKSASGGLMLYQYRKRIDSRMLIREGLPSNDLTAVAIDGKVAWVGGRGFVAVVDAVPRKVLRIAYISANEIRDIKLSPAHAWIAVSCEKEGSGGSEFAGNAATGVYRIERAAVEGGMYTAQTDTGK